MSTRAPRFMAALLAALTLLTMTMATASAATGPVPEDYTFEERGINAHASWQSCSEPDGTGQVRCAYTNVQVFDGRQHNSDPEFGNANEAFSYLCLVRYEDVLDADGNPVGPPREEGGCVNAPEILVVDDLEHLAVSTSLELVEWACESDPETGEGSCEPVGTRTVALDIELTGVGDALPDRWRSSGTILVDDQRCHFSSSSRGVGRDAVATMSIDGSSSGPSEFAFMTEGRTRSTQRCA